ncbi:DUF669 domain-containing protein [Novacetimonas pomaceti]|uniref:DUF669 domain-containing protein n=1 Tax=Novacetimonas pomaceti TaxID=2021998 RepID=UPI001C2D697E|nr:DUF669 domain-containing protein [Novacetimonas pomaceti]MBV1833059.1 DUF669 domain-containing protein [Novacetimonas pomaceti]
MSGNLSGLYDHNSAPDLEDRQFELLPPGDYDGDIVKAELRETRSGNMIALDIKLDNNRHVFDNLNIVCRTSAKAEEIARGSLKRIGQINNRIIQDTQDLVLCRVRVQVGVQPPQGNYEARNVVKFYKDPNGATASAPVRPAARPATASAARTAPAASAAPQANGARSWMRSQPAQQAAAPIDDEIPF